jgi:hypothetical protein
MSKSLREKTNAYWRISRAWRGRDQKLHTFEQLLDDLKGLLRGTMSMRLLALTVRLEDDVVMNRRCRKKLPPNNLVSLQSQRTKKAGHQHTQATQQQQTKVA